MNASSTARGLAAAVLGFNLLGDGLRDALDPRRVGAMRDHVDRRGARASWPQGHALKAMPRGTCPIGPVPGDMPFKTCPIDPPASASA